MKWFRRCVFCDMQPVENNRPWWDIRPRAQKFEHQSHCVWRKTMRAAEWAKNGIVVILDGRRAKLPEDQ